METNTFNFDDILDNAKEVFHNLKAGADCPPDDMLLDYVYGKLTDMEYADANAHIHACERCRVETLNMEADKTQWEMIMDHAGEEASLQKADLSVLETLKNQGMKLADAFVSGIKQGMIRWISPAWEPMWAGQALTAADMPEQPHTFDMEDGEYINISCYWQGKAADRSSYIQLAWKANIVTEGKLWARFMNLQNQEILAEFCLGTDLQGKEMFYEEELGFDPSSQRFAITVFVQDIEER